MVTLYAHSWHFWSSSQEMIRFSSNPVARPSCSHWIRVSEIDFTRATHCNKQAWTSGTELLTLQEGNHSGSMSCPSRDEQRVDTYNFFRTSPQFFVRISEWKTETFRCNSENNCSTFTESLKERRSQGGCDGVSVPDGPSSWHALN